MAKTASLLIFAGLALATLGLSAIMPISFFEQAVIVCLTMLVVLKCGELWESE